MSGNFEIMDGVERTNGKFYWIFAKYTMVNFITKIIRNVRNCLIFIDKKSAKFQGVFVNFRGKEYRLLQKLTLLLYYYS